MNTLNTKTLTLTALCAALLCVLSPMSIPLPGGVPISLATLAAAFAGALLGPKYGTLSVLLYLLLGAFGLPVFAGYSAGLSSFVKPSSGYLIGYLFLAFLTGLIYHNFGHTQKGVAKLILLFVAQLAGEVVLYIFGTAWFMYLMGAQGNAALATLGGALGACVIPFIPGDCAKMIVVCLMIPALEKALNAAGLQVKAA
ncbi:MAG TPA: biotin transporter BioY [Oribacterium sp.]|nr:biotin transporter BioY [Oribacterium sp.]HCS67026.1 biotin transporter BioY [Oribacterium sp.]